ncbi:MAG: hypothetical protein WCL44_15560, partial [bacterium]
GHRGAQIRFQQPLDVGVHIETNRYNIQRAVSGQGGKNERKGHFPGDACMHQCYRCDVINDC